MRRGAIGMASAVIGCLLVATAVGAEEIQQEAAAAQTVQDGMTVTIDYTLTVDGKVVDTSEGREPLSYVQGQGQIIPGLEHRLAGMSAGQSASVAVSPEEGYGPVDPEGFVQVPKTQLPPDLSPAVGVMLRGTSPDGQPFRATISGVGAESVTLNLNHPLAGKTLQFDVKVVEVTAGS